MKRAIIIGSLLLSANVAAAQSFDCSKAATRTEKMICADPAVAMLDAQLSEQYKRLLPALKTPNGAIAVQRRWLAEKRNAAATPAALKKLYEDRLGDVKLALECATGDANWTTLQLNDCAFIAFESSEAELGEVYRKLLASPDAEPAKEAAAALKASQDAWLKFRDAECERFTFDSRGGSMHPMLVLDCRRSMTQQRIKELPLQDVQ